MQVFDRSRKKLDNWYAASVLLGGGQAIGFEGGTAGEGCCVPEFLVKWGCLSFPACQTSAGDSHQHQGPLPPPPSPTPDKSSSPRIHTLGSDGTSTLTPGKTKV